jgi:hypothetical protein
MPLVVGFKSVLVQLFYRKEHFRYVTGCYNLNIVSQLVASFFHHSKVGTSVVSLCYQSKTWPWPHLTYKLFTMEIHTQTQQ